MGVVSVYDVGAGVNGRPAEVFLIAGGAVAALHTPVEGADHDLRPLIPQGADFGLHIRHTEIKAGRIQADLQAAVGGHHGGAVLFHIGKICLFQRLYGGIIAHGAEVHGVVVGQGHRLHGGAGEDLRVLGRAPEGEQLVRGRAVLGQSGLQIRHGEVVRLEILPNQPEGIGIVIPDGLNVAGLIPVGGGGAAGGAVAHKAQDIPLLLRAGFLCLLRLLLPGCFFRVTGGRLRLSGGKRFLFFRLGGIGGGSHPVIVLRRSLAGPVDDQNADPRQQRHSQGDERQYFCLSVHSYLRSSRGHGREVRNSPVPVSSSGCAYAGRDPAPACGCAGSWGCTPAARRPPEIPGIAPEREFWGW